MSLGTIYSLYCLECCRNISESELKATEKTVWCAAYPTNQLIKSYTRSFLALGGLHEDKLWDTLWAMIPTNIETVHQTSSLHIESSLDRLGLLSPTRMASILSNKPDKSPSTRFHQPAKPRCLKATHYTEMREFEIPWSVVGEVLSWWMKPARDPAVQSHVHPWKIPTSLARSPLLVGPRRKKTDRGQR